MEDPTLVLLARLWAKAIATDGYEETEWKELRRRIMRLRSVPDEVRKGSRR